MIAAHLGSPFAPRQSMFVLMTFFRKPADMVDGATEIVPSGARARPAKPDMAAALVALGAKIAKADGQVTQDEVEAFRQVFRPDPGSEAAVAKLFNLARKTTAGFQGYAKKLARRWRSYPAILEDVLDALFHIALADGIITSHEELFLQRVAEIFGFSDREYRRIRQSHIAPDPDDPYLILGVDPDVDCAGLRRAYRRMAVANHPDRLAARGLPRELEKLSHDKMAAINRAYRRILKERSPLRRCKEAGAEADYTI